MNPQPCCAAAAALALCLSACSGAGTTVRTLSGPSSASMLNASIMRGTSSLATKPTPPGSIGTQSICVAGAPFAPTFQVAITAFESVNLSRVTIRLIDGSSLGSTISFPQPQLASQFGSVFIPAGTTRMFPFTPQFTCGPQTPQGVSADIGFFDVKGLSHDITVVGSL